MTHKMSKIARVLRILDGKIAKYESVLKTYTYKGTVSTKRIDIAVLETLIDLRLTMEMIR